MTTQLHEDRDRRWFPAPTSAAASHCLQGGWWVLLPADCDGWGPQHQQQLCYHHPFAQPWPPWVLAGWKRAWTTGIRMGGREEWWWHPTATVDHPPTISTACRWWTPQHDTNARTMTGEMKDRWRWQVGVQCLPMDAPPLSHSLVRWQYFLIHWLLPTSMTGATLHSFQYYSPLMSL